MAVTVMTNLAAYRAWQALSDEERAKPEGRVSWVTRFGSGAKGSGSAGVSHGSMCRHAPDTWEKWDEAWADPEDASLHSECVTCQWEDDEEGKSRPVFRLVSGEAVEKSEGGGHSPTCHVNHGLFMVTKDVGRVLSTGERNGYHDSDFTVTVWRGGEHGYRDTYVYASTRGWTYPNHARPDATSEVLDWVEADNERREAAYWLGRKRDRCAEAWAAALNDTSKGQWVRVYKGRKVPVGTTGVIIWKGAGNYGERVGILTSPDTEPVWTASSNVCREWLTPAPEWARAKRETVEAREAEIATALREVTLDSWARVSRGKHSGTEGLVIWRGSGRYGERVGLATTGRKTGKGKRAKYQDVTWVGLDLCEPAEEGRAAWA